MIRKLVTLKKNDGIFALIEHILDPDTSLDCPFCREELVNFQVLLAM